MQLADDEFALEAPKVPEAALSGFEAAQRTAHLDRHEAPLVVDEVERLCIRTGYVGHHNDPGWALREAAAFRLLEDVGDFRHAAPSEADVR